MNSELFTQILMGIITIIGAIVTYYVVPLLKSKMGEAEYAKFIDFVKKLVRAANQVYDDNNEKKEYVKNQALAWLQVNKIDLSDEQVEAIIEGLVNEVKKFDNLS